MPLPPELAEHPDETAVIGDLEAFMEYVECGEAFKDWNDRLTQRIRELKELF